MKASVTIGILASVFLALPTTAFAHSLKRVRVELRSQGYDQIEFARTKFPVWVNACRGSKRLHLHVDWYGKVTVTDETPTGSCPTEGAESENSTVTGAPETKNRTAAKKIPESSVELTDGAKSPKDVGCKTFLPAIGMTVSVVCE